ncbi:hypothetical protein QBC36DRAFT_300905 [Triangularia setosa]|uniref:Uncharacterized protein n=1 Tax=Triangularia setosa TaxID=2587417 RepID=A0AAN7A654_9PEZI|nr:hypothetical protein QBC36DRAFT_300905 [Podospora setosa]
MAVVYGQSPAMAEPRDLGWGQVPEPLHIHKQSAEYSEIQTYGHSQRSSTQSNATDASFKSVPKPPSDDVPLTIPKRRVNPSAQSTNSPAHNGSHQFNSALRPNGGSFPPGHDDIFYLHQTDIAPVIPPRSSQRRSNSCNVGRHARARSPQSPRPFNPAGGGNFQRRGQVLDGSTDQDSHHGWRDTTPIMPTASNIHRLRNARSLFHLARAANGMDSIVEPPRSPIPLEPDSPSSSPDEPPPTSPLVLVPKIVVTPEHKALDEGAVSLWAAVQLSTQISRANAPVQQGRGDEGCGWVGEHGHEPSPPDLFRYGCLYDVSVEILSTGRSSIVEVVDDKACAISTLYPGSRLLVVAHVRLFPSANTHRLRRNAHQSSDDLMEDLEHHLGSTMTEYLQVRITYRHSGFPQQQQQQMRNMAMKNGFNNGIANVQTSIQTTAVAVIKRHNSSSPWSPRPRAPQPNPIFEIIASHWGVQSANEVMQRIIGSRPLMARKGAMSPLPLGPLGILTGGRFTPSLISPEESGEEDHRRRHYSDNSTKEDSQSEEVARLRPQQVMPTSSSAPPTRMAPPIPSRQTSLRQVSVDQQQQQHPEQHPQQRHLRSDTEDIAHMIKIGSWPESPRTSADSGEGFDGTTNMTQQTPSSVSMATPATTSTSRTIYRLSKVRRVPSSLKMSGGGGGVSSPPVTPTTAAMSIEEGVEMPRNSIDSAGTASTGGRQQAAAIKAERERQSYQSSQSWQSLTQSSLRRRKSMGGDGPSSQEGNIARERDRGRESRDSRESRGDRSRPSTSGGQGGTGEKMFTSIMRTVESVNGNGGSMGRKASKKEKDKDKERGWGGWSGWWQ